MPTRAAIHPSELEVSAGRTALDRLLSDPAFRASDRNKRFLHFVTEAYLSGQGQRIKSYAIAIDVFGRGEDFNPALDPIVRIEANRLRAALAAYYAGPGRSERIRIDIPKGAYVPAIVDVSEGVTTGIAEGGSSVASRTAGSNRSRGTLLTSYRTAGVAVVALVIALVAFAGGWFRSPLEQQVPAVLVATADADADIIGQNDHPINLGFARSVQLALSRFEGIRVFAVPTGLSFADTIAKMNSTGRRTGSIYLLETGVKDEGQTTRFWWTLKNAANGEVIWSDLVDQPVAVGVSPSLEDAVAADIARVIGQPLGLVASRESQTTGQTSLTGYTCVLKARAYFVSVSESLHREVRSCLEQTVVSSPDYAEAHALLAWMYLEEDRNGFNLRTTHENALADALLAAQRAAELAPQSATVMEALMAIYYRKGDFDTAFEFGRRAMALNPHNPELAGSLGTRLFARGHWDEGAALVQESLKNSLIAQPLDRITLVLDCYRRAKYKEALDQAQQLGVPDFYGQWVLLAAIYAKLGERDQAKTAVTELLRLRPYYASELRDDMHSRHYTEPMIDMIADGLSAAGLTVQ